VQQHLGVPVDPPIELVVCLNGIIDADIMADDEAWLGYPRYDEIAKVSVVCFDIALSSAK